MKSQNFGHYSFKRKPKTSVKNKTYVELELPHGAKKNQPSRSLWKCTDHSIQILILFSFPYILFRSFIKNLLLYSRFIK